MEGTKQQVIVATIGVFLSASKIVTGTGLLLDCPVQDLLPVYLVASGCLPALLCAWRGIPAWNQPGGGSMLVNRVWLIIASVGILLNIACLAAGTWLVATTWPHVATYVCVESTAETGAASGNITANTTYPTTVSTSSLVHSSGGPSTLVYNSSNVLDSLVSYADNATSTTTETSVCEIGSELVQSCALPLLVFATSMALFDWLFVVVSCFYCVTGRWRVFCDYNMLPQHDQLATKLTTKRHRHLSVKWQDEETV